MASFLCSDREAHCKAYATSMARIRLRDAHMGYLRQDFVGGWGRRLTTVP